MTIPQELRYTESHEWIGTDGDIAVIGITDHAQKALGDITFVELPAPGAKVNRGDPFGVIESVKAASDVFAPIDGEVIESNGLLDDKPELVNQSPYDQGWLVKIRRAESDMPDTLLDSNAYAKLLESEQ